MRGNGANIITTPRARGVRHREELTTVQFEEFGFFSGLRPQSDVRIMLVRFGHTVCDRNVVVRAGCASSHRAISHRKFDSDETAAGSLVAASSSTRDKKLNRSTRVVPCGLRKGSQLGRARRGVKPTTESRQRGETPWDLRADLKGLFISAPQASDGLRDTPENLLGDLPVFGRHDVLALSESIRRQHLIAQLAQTNERPAIPGTAPRHLRDAVCEIKCRSSHGSRNQKVNS